MYFKKIVGSNPNVFAKVFDDNTMHAITITKRDNQPPLWSFDGNAVIIATDDAWTVSTPYEYNQKCRDLKAIINDSINS